MLRPLVSVQPSPTAELLVVLKDDPTRKRRPGDTGDGAPDVADVGGELGLAFGRGGRGRGDRDPQPRDESREGEVNETAGETHGAWWRVEGDMEVRPVERDRVEARVERVEGWLVGWARPRVSVVGRGQSLAGGESGTTRNIPLVDRRSWRYME